MTPRHALVAIDLRRGDDYLGMLHAVLFENPPSRDDRDGIMCELRLDEELGMVGLRCGIDYVLAEVPIEAFSREAAAVREVTRDDR